jgi:serine/threonine protein kinase
VGFEHRIGELFDGRYRLERQIGSGGMADVYLAADETLGRSVAIKLLADRYTRDDGFIERFRREATAAAGLTHANIVGIYDRGQADGQYYIAMEYVEGETLKDEINAHAPLPAEEAISYAQQALQALEFAHKRGVIHRDVKPHNMMINGDGVLKMTDFGIARAANMTDMTEVGSIVGTAQYLSPEQARGQAVGPQSDIYAMGIVLYEMLTGELPFTGGSAVEIAMKQVQDAPEPPSRRNRLISPALEQVVMRALAKDPQYRYRSAREMADDLERVRRGLAVSQDTQQATRVMAPVAAPATQVMDSYRQAPPPQPPPQSRRSFLPWFLVLLFLLAAAAVGFYVYSQFQSSGVTVPDVVGLKSETAKNRLKAEGFQVTAKQRESSVGQKGKVVETDPGPGSTADKGSTVTMFVGSGPNTVKIPNLRGKDFNEASSELTALGLQAPNQQQVTSKLPAGEVVRSDPGPGEQVPLSTVVTLFVSNGNVKVPDTTGLDCEGAKQKLQSAGLTGDCQDEPSDTVPKGEVTRTSPAAGSPVVQGTNVTIFVSSGPAQVEVPDVTGMTVTDARAALHSAGLTDNATACLSSDPTATPGTVVHQDPAAGAQVDPGSTVDILVHRTDATTPCPP